MWHVNMLMILPHMTSWHKIRVMTHDAEVFLLQNCKYCNNIRSVISRWFKRKQLQEESLDASIMEVRDKRNRADSNSSESFGENINVRNLKNAPKHKNPYKQASQG